MSLRLLSKTLMQYRMYFKDFFVIEIFDEVTRTIQGHAT